MTAPRTCEACEGSGRVYYYGHLHAVTVVPASRHDKAADRCDTCRGLLGCPSCERFAVKYADDHAEGLCDDCAARLLCAGCGECRGAHGVDGDFYCDICAAGLVVMAQRALGQLPRVFDTIPAPCGAEEV